MTAVWENGPREPSKRFLLLSLADHANDAGTNCFPGLDLLAEKTQISVRQVQRLLRILEADGWISILKSGCGRGHMAEFLLNVAKLGLRKGDMVTPFQKMERVTSATLKGDICDNPPAPPIRKNHQETSIKNKTPLPPLQASGECVERVMRACGWVNRRLRPMIAEAIVLAAERGDAEWDVAGRMIASWQSLQQRSQAGLMRYAISPRKFIAEAHWRTDAMWPYDQEKLRDMQQASVGAMR